MNQQSPTPTNQKMLLISVALCGLSLFLFLILALNSTGSKRSSLEIYQADQTSYAVRKDGNNYTLTMTSAGGVASGIVGQIEWNPAQYTYQGAEGADGDDFNPMVSVGRTGDGIVTVALLPKNLGSGETFNVPASLDILTVTLIGSGGGVSGSLDLSKFTPGEGTNTPTCSSDVDCDDNNDCTTDTCINPGDPITSECKHVNNPQDGLWTYSAWSACSGACGGGTGTQTRTATCSATCGGTCGAKGLISQSCTNNTPCNSVCTPNQTRCQGAQVQTCKSDGSGWGNPTNCPYGQTCDGNVCEMIGDPCVPNCSCKVNTCVGSTCSDRCGGRCNGTKTSGECSITVCTPGQTKCLSSQVQLCKNDGSEWGVPANCPDGSTCSGNSCTEVTTLKTGDIDGDGDVDIVDAVLEIELIFGNATVGDDRVHVQAKQDVNGDGSTNINDVLEIINIAFSSGS